MPVFYVNNSGQTTFIGGDTTADVFNIQNLDSYDVYLTGGGGNDLYYVTTDWSQFLDNVLITELAGGGTDTLQFQGNSYGSGNDYNLDANIENLILSAESGSYGNIVGNNAANLINVNGSGNDTLQGGLGNDTLLSGYGDDSLNGGAGIDSMTGGNDNDRYQVDVSGDVIVELSGEGNDTVESSATAYTLSANIEELWLTGTANINGTGNADGNNIEGNTGNNSISGLAGNDTLDGDDGNDTLLGGAGTDFLDGGNGNDSLSGEADSDDMLGGDGNDTLLGGLGNDFLSGEGNNDSLVGDAGQDTLWGSSGNDILLGGADRDVLWGEGGADSIDGGDGNDVIYNAEDSLFSDDNSVDTLLGGNGDDEIYGYDGDVMNAGAGNDTMYSYGDDVLSSSLDGGAGEDTLYLTNYAASTYSMHANTENLFLEGEGLDITGNAAANYIEGDDGDDTLRGQGGNDVLFGEGGTDMLFGGAGNDNYLVYDGDTAVELLAGDGALDTVYAMTNQYVLGNFIENLVFGGTTGDLDFFGRGNALNNSIRGSASTDDFNTLIGMAGNDTLDGLGGEGILIGGAGNDTYRTSFDWETSPFVPGVRIVELNNEGLDTVVYGGEGSIMLGSNLEILTLTNSEGAFANGNALANTINGSSGNDWIDGGRGNDSMAGGDDTDFYWVDSAADVVSELANQGDDLVYASVSYTLTDVDVESLQLLEAGRINGTGNASDNDIEGNYSANVLTGLGGHDSLWGDRGADTLVGGDGNDTLDGGAGADSMNGGNGGDLYYVNQIADVVNETGIGGTDEVSSWINNYTYTLGANLENLTLSASGSGVGNTLNNLISDDYGGDNTLSGLDGNDTLEGGNGSDTLDGGIGNDLLNGGSGDDSMIGGAGNDTFMVDSVSDVLSEIGGGGTDTVISTVSFTLANDSINGVFEHLILQGENSISGTGTTGANSITGNDSHNVLDGGDGNDTIVGNAGHDTIYGGTSTLSGADLLDGGAGEDIIFGGDGNDTLLGAGDNDNLHGEAGNDSLNGGTGDDSLEGSYGNDALVGDAGNDSLFGGLGNDTMTGGTGDDWYYVDAALDVVSETGGSGLDHVYSTVSFTLQAGLENLDLLEGAAVNGIGNGENNAIEGNTNSNSLAGAVGNDTLDGNDGNDTLVGDAGNDSLFGGLGNDSVTGGLGNDSLQGDDDNDSLAGGDGNDLITGGNGNDTLIGDAGNDVLSGGEGVNFYNGGTGNDLYNYEGSTASTIAVDTGGVDIVNLWSLYGAGTFNAGTLGIEEVRNQASGTVTIDANGGSVNNLFRGINMDASYTMNGGGGNDTLELWTDGENGPHSITGGDGTDLVLLVTSSGPVESVNTFTVETVDITGGGSVSINDDSLTGVVTYLVDDYFGDLTLSSDAGGTGENMTLRLGESFDFGLNLGEGIDTVTIISEGLTDSGEAAITLDAGENSVKITGDAELGVYTQNDDDEIELENFNATRISFGEGNPVDPFNLNLTLDNVNTELLAGGFHYLNLNVASNSEIWLDSDLGGPAELNVSGAGNLTLNVLDADPTLDFSQYQGDLVLTVVHEENDTNFVFVMGEGDDQVYSGEGNDFFDFTGAGGNRLDYADAVFGGEGEDSLTADISGYDTDPAGGTFSIESVETITFNAGLDANGLQLDLAGIEPWPADGPTTVYLQGGVGNDAQFWTIENLRVNLNASESGIALDLTFGEGGIVVTGSAYGDTIVMEEDAEGGSVEINSGGGNDSIVASEGSDSIDGGSGNDSISGGAGDDAWLRGVDGDDTISGGDGNDAIAGGTGVDSITGDAGADKFYYAEHGEGVNADVITDFESGIDQLYLDTAVFIAIGTGTLGEGQFVAGEGAGDLDDRIIFDATNGNLYYDEDGSGIASAQVLIATIMNDGEPGSITYSDIIGY